MYIPPEKKIQIEEVARQIAEFAASNYEEGPDGAFVCKKCRSQIMATTLFVSIHLAMFGDTCAGNGQVERIELPYCPQCDKEVEDKTFRSCTHV